MTGRETKRKKKGFGKINENFRSEISNLKMRLPYIQIFIHTKCTLTNKHKNTNTQNLE